MAVSSESSRSILILRPGGIGDAVHLIPIISAIKAHLPASEIVILAERRNSKIFELSPAVNNIYCYDRPREFFKVFRRPYDVVIDTEQWHYLSAVVTRFVRSQRSVGFATNSREKMFTDSVSYSHDDYEAVSFARLLVPLEVPFVPPVGRFLSVPASASEKIQKMLTGLPLECLVVLFPGASIPERRWPPEKFAELAGLLHKSGCSVVIIGGPDDRQAGDVIAAGGRALNLAGNTSLIESAAILAKSALLVSGDSGVLHIAVGLNVPTVSLFGPGIARKWAPLGERHRVINLELPCSPCTRFGTTPPCAIGAKCIQEITVGQVWEQVQVLLQTVVEGD